jgi:methionyl-tRNA formyltransferase
MNRLFFVLNDLSEFTFHEILERHLSNVSVDVGTQLPSTPSDYRLIILWSYRQVIRTLPDPNNVILFHSSDLPQGRGWAPIYHTLSENRPEYVISGIFAGPQVDTGDVIVKARFAIAPNITAPDLRRFDHEVSILLVQKILDRFGGGAIRGMPQKGVPSYWKRRNKEDNAINVKLPFLDLIPHLRACEPSSPTFFEHAGQRYTVTITPAMPAEFPKGLRILFAEDMSNGT